MYRWVPGGLHEAGPNPQPALPQRLHFFSSCSSLLRIYCFWPRLSCAGLGCILPSSFSPGDPLNQSPGSLFGSSATSFLEARGFALPASRRGCPSRSASLRKMRLLLILLSASGESHASIISESQCLGYPYSPSCREGSFSEIRISNLASSTASQLSKRPHHPAHGPQTTPHRHENYHEK